MPLSYRLAPRAIADMEQIAAWITTRADRETALAYTDRIQAACEKLLLMPGGGTPRPSFGNRFRSVSFERKLIILYRVERQTLVVKRILHGSRDQARMLRSVRRRW